MATTTTTRSLLSVPLPLAKLFSYFPLKAYPPLKPARLPVLSPLLWIHPPSPSAPGQENVLSADVECLKWQAHVALRGLQNVSVRWDVSQEGALDGRLPNLQIPSERTNNPDGELLAAQDIPTWMDGKVGALDDLEGYKDVESRDESHAWIALLEGDVHAALVSLLQRFTLSPHTFITVSDCCIGIRPAPAFLFLPFRPPASPGRRSTTGRDHPHAPTSAAHWLLVSATPLRRASLTERHHSTIPRRNHRPLRAIGTRRMVPGLAVRNTSLRPTPVKC